MLVSAPKEAFDLPLYSRMTERYAPLWAHVPTCSRAPVRPVAPPIEEMLVGQLPSPVALRDSAIVANRTNTSRKGIGRRGSRPSQAVPPSIGAVATSMALATQVNGVG